MSDLRAVRVVVADDHPTWRSGLTADLGSDFEVVGEAGDADQTIEALLVLGEFRRTSRTAGPAQPLSEREREVLQHAARGHTYREIGEQLSIAETTVEDHGRDILGELHRNRGRELVRYALGHGVE